MTHQNWVKKQFSKRNTALYYRNVLIHVSFIETIVKEESGSSSFDCAIKILKANPKYKNELLQEINTLRIKRNSIVHDILKNKVFKTDNDIDKIVKEMHSLLRIVYSRSDFIYRHFFNKYSINTKTIFGIVKI